MVSGPSALEHLERVCTAKMDQPLGSCTYTLILNGKGGIEGDLVVSRLEQDKFYLTVPSNTTRYAV